MASPSFTIPQGLLKLMSIELVQNRPGIQMLPEMGAEALLWGYLGGQAVREAPWGVTMEISRQRNPVEGQGECSSRSRSWSV